MVRADGTIIGRFMDRTNTVIDVLKKIQWTERCSNQGDIQHNTGHEIAQLTFKLMSPWTAIRDKTQNNKVQTEIIQSFNMGSAVDEQSRNTRARCFPVQENNYKNLHGQLNNFLWSLVKCNWWLWQNSCFLTVLNRERTVYTIIKRCVD